MVWPSWTRGKDQAVDVGKDELAEVLPVQFNNGRDVLGLLTTYNDHA